MDRCGGNSAARACCGARAHVATVRGGGPGVRRQSNRYPDPGLGRTLCECRPRIEQLPGLERRTGTGAGRRRRRRLLSLWSDPREVERSVPACDQPSPSRPCVRPARPLVVVRRRSAGDAANLRSVWKRRRAGLRHIPRDRGRRQQPASRRPRRCRPRGAGSAGGEARRQPHRSVQSPKPSRT